MAKGPELKENSDHDGTDNGDHDGTDNGDHDGTDNGEIDVKPDETPFLGGPTDSTACPDHSLDGDTIVGPTIVIFEKNWKIYYSDGKEITGDTTRVVEETKNDNNPVVRNQRE